MKYIEIKKGKVRIEREKERRRDRGEQRKSETKAWEKNERVT